LELAFGRDSSMSRISALPHRKVGTVFPNTAFDCQTRD
jgi:hypothetical protein